MNQDRPVHITSLIEAVSHKEHHRLEMKNIPNFPTSPVRTELTSIEPIIYSLQIFSWSKTEPCILGSLHKFIINEI